MKVDTLILGAGTSGLAAAYTLVKAGRKPVVLERDKVPGGLFRSIHRNGFVVDIGRKELYNRIARVDAFWHGLLGGDYRIYSHRGGILYQGRILDMSPGYQGFRRGMSWRMLLGCGVDFLWARAKPWKSAPRNVEAYFYQKRGRKLTRIAAQGFQEKLTGKKWSEIPLHSNGVNGHDGGFFSTVTGLATRIVSKKEVNTFEGIWKHPAKGTGQICDLLAAKILKAGAQIHYQATMLGMQTAARSQQSEVGCQNATVSSQISPSLASFPAVKVNGQQSAERGQKLEGSDQRSEITSLTPDRRPRTADRWIRSVTAETGGEMICFEPEHVISSVPPEILKRFLYGNQKAEGSDQRSEVTSQTSQNQPLTSEKKRTVVLVYLFLNEAPRFPHAWLQVTCPTTRIGRITNYAAFSPDMVPPGKSCLCCEIYCFGPDKLLELDDKATARQALEDCAKSGLLDPAKCFDHLILRLPGADASQNRDNWMSPSRLKLLADLAPFSNLFYVNRTETDIATLAGIEAAEAILSGDRTQFDRNVNPAELGIRSESKAFSFDLPVAVEA